ncbi:MAG: MFS transporter [Agathobaculum butyriciproducens]|jgi:GPH family glycoside/pentoside/hexuronide:cation symporter|nr:MFS transporter [Butyricicoccus sp. BIOML-A1]MEE0154781.1 MFS transporter [Agathobaculum butyriciproducens]MZT26732.1 MFS transporter [Butyricicoccus sp. BIOML-A1]
MSDKNTTTQLAGDVKISMREKIAYGLGDTSCNIVVGLTTSLLTFFYTDYIGVPVTMIGLIILISRFFDGGSDVVMGLIVDRTKSKYGKARPWVLWASIPYAIGCVLLFTVPPTSTTVKVIYIFITYNFIQTVCYTALNLPYSSLAALMTRNQYERGSINAIRMALSPFGRILATAVTLPLVKALGDDQRAWIMAAAIYGAIALALLLFCFFNTKERVQLAADQADTKVPISISLKALFKNKYWALGLLLWAMLSVYMTLSGTSLSYYSKWILGNSLLTSPLYLAEQIPCIVLTFFIPLALKKISKRNLALAGAIICIVGQIGLIFDDGSFTFAMVSSICRGIGQAPLMGVVFSFIADSVEYGQYKTHLRLEGLIYSAASVGSKLGGGLMSAAFGWILGWAGYDGLLEVQSATTIHTISALFVWGPIIVWGVTAIILLFHRLEKEYPAIMEELAAREARGEL